MSKKIIVNAARAIDIAGGVSNVANALDRELQRLGCQTERFTLQDSGLRAVRTNNLFFKKIWLIIEVLWAGIVGTWLLKRRFPKDRYFVICHNDFLYGQVFVNHGLHKALVKQRGLLKSFITNPLHLILYVRESWRHAQSVHDVVVCLSEQQKEEFLLHFPKQQAQVVCIPNGIDLQRFMPEGPIPEDSTNWRSTSGEKLMVFVGHEFVRKGLRFAIDALTHLDECWKLVVVGGDDRQVGAFRKLANDRLVEDRVLFLGPRNDVDKIYRACDTFVLPASFEPWGLVAVEALASGLPIIMTDTGSAKSFLRPQKNGFFCQQSGKDIADKAQQTQELNSTKEEIRQSVSHFDWHQVAKQYQQLVAGDA